MSWRDIAAGHWGEQLRLGILRATEQVYDENCQRFAPLDIGDNNKTFGVNVSENLHFLLERDVVAVMDGVEVQRPRNAWVLRLWGGVVLYIYKAPPGVTDVRQLRFRSSKTKLDLVTENADQLSFVFEEGLAPRGRAGLKHVVLVHFGDPETGLVRIDVGAPYLTDLNGCEWEWVECLSALQPYVEGDAETSGELASDSMVDEDFDLEMRDEAEDEGEQDYPGPS